MDNVGKLRIWACPVDPVSRGRGMIMQEKGFCTVPLVPLLQKKQNMLSCSLRGGSVGARGTVSACIGGRKLNWATAALRISQLQS